jgi:hypothetical protein
MAAVVQVLDPIDPARYRTTAELREATRAAIAEVVGVPVPGVPSEHGSTAIR